MLLKTIFKLVLRNWWRNKTFSIISILSLAIGIACSFLLAVFVVHEYNVETHNPNRNRIHLISQDYPMMEGVKVAYVFGDALRQMELEIPEIEQTAVMMDAGFDFCEYQDKRITDVSILYATNNFLSFFPHEVVYGDLQDASTKPDQVILSNSFSKKLFGKTNPINQVIRYKSSSGEVSDLTVGAVVREKDQSLIYFEALSFQELNGGVTFAMTLPTVTSDQLAAKIKQAGIMGLTNTCTYYAERLQDAYFNTSFRQQAMFFLKNREKNLLHIGFITSLFILAIAAFNYINLNFSRILQQVKLIHTEKLMGATNREIRKQLFADTFLMVIISFLLSLLLIFDFIPLFNHIIHGDLTFRFFFSSQIWPVMLLLILILSVIPAFYISGKLYKLTGSDYRLFFTGQKKRRTTSGLVLLQFMFSIGLLIGLITVNKQINLVKKGASQYENLISVGDNFGGPSLEVFKQEISLIPGVVSSSTSMGDIMHSPIKDNQITLPDGTVTSFGTLLFFGVEDYFETTGIRLLEGMPREEARKVYPSPVYINRKYVEKLVPSGEDYLFKPLVYFDPDASFNSDSISVIAGVIDDFFTNSLEEEILPCQVNFTKDHSCVMIRLDGRNNAATIQQIQTVWEDMFPNLSFSTSDQQQEFIQRNQRMYEMSDLLLMYTLISLFLTCFGLFGMAIYATGQRAKEIGIRKVNGSSTLQILYLLNREFLMVVIIAFCIALPVTWYFLNRWLENYVYRTDISFVSCMAGLAIVLVVTILTVSWHSYKSATANPVDVLRTE